MTPCPAVRRPRGLRPGVEKRSSGAAGGRAQLREVRGVRAEKDGEWISAIVRSRMSGWLGVGWAKLLFRVDLVEVPASPSLTRHIAFLDQLGHDPVRRPLGDANRLGDVAEPDCGIVRYAQQDVRMIRQEGPLRHRGG